MSLKSIVLNCVVGTLTSLVCSGNKWRPEQPNLQTVAGLRVQSLRGADWRMRQTIDKVHRERVRDEVKNYFANLVAIRGVKFALGQYFSGFARDAYQRAHENSLERYIRDAVTPNLSPDVKAAYLREQAEFSAYRQETGDRFSYLDDALVRDRDHFVTPKEFTVAKPERKKNQPVTLLNKAGLREALTCVTRQYPGSHTFDLNNDNAVRSVHSLYIYLVETKVSALATNPQAIHIDFNADVVVGGENPAQIQVVPFAPTKVYGQKVTAVDGDDIAKKVLDLAPSKTTRFIISNSELDLHKSSKLKSAKVLGEITVDVIPPIYEEDFQAAAPEDARQTLVDSLLS